VAGLCGALLRSRTEAEDAVQQTFLSAHRALLNGSRPEQPAAWLATIARNECWSRIRMRMREPLPAEAIEAVSPEPDPLAEAIRKADLAALWLAIEALPRAQRDALLLREFGGLSYEELAAALAVSGPAVESLLFRARRRLRAHLRATLASVAGASWLDALARAFAGSSAPVAAKVAALGIGAAAVTGGAVVVPDVLDRTRAPLQPARRAPADAAHAHPAPVSAGSSAVTRLRPVGREPVSLSAERARSDSRTGGRLAGGRGGSFAEDRGSREGARSTGSDSGSSAGDGGSRDGSSSDGVSGDGATRDGTSSRDGGGDGGSSGPLAAVTPATAPASADPALTVPLSSTDGHGDGSGGDGGGGGSGDGGGDGDGGLP
jgi:RNA polymerase sigma factor (sigma-70 family)